jgi:fructokinase
MRIGIDLGGTKIEGIALDVAGGVMARRRIDTPRGDYTATLQAVATLVQGLERETGLAGTVGIGIPGTISPATGLVKNANSTWLIGKPFDRDLADLLHRDIRTANDANCFALSEAVDGAAHGARVVFGAILGTGTGGGVVVEQRVVLGSNAIAGEWGHNPVPWPEPGEWPGPSCYCGRTGCLETFLSGPGFARDYTQAGGLMVQPPDIVARAEAGEAHAVAALERYCDRLARGLASVMNVLDPDVIVLGGGLSNIARLYDAVPQRWRRFVFSDHIATQLVRAKHGDASGVRGAAWLWD